MDITELRGELTTLKKQTDLAVKLVGEISRFERNRMRNLPQLRKRLVQLEPLISQLSQKEELFEALQNWTTHYQQALLNAEQELKKRFGIELQQELKKKGLSLSGQYPELKAGLFTIQLDLDRERVTLWYGPKQERLLQCPFKAADVANRVERVRVQLGSRLAKEEFLERLHEAYSHLIGVRTEALLPREPVPIIDVLTELAYVLQDSRFRQDPRQEHYKGYGRADFSYDLFRLRQSRIDKLNAAKSGEVGRLHLAVATRSRTRRRRDFLWVPDSESGKGTTYSHLQFREMTE